MLSGPYAERATQDKPLGALSLRLIPDTKMEVQLNDLSTKFFSG